MRFILFAAVISLACPLSSLAQVFEMPKIREAPADKSAPSQHRVAYAGPDGVAVSWNTYEKLDNPQVKYGLSAEDLSMSISSEVSITYSTSTTWNNHVVLSELLPDTTYYYQVSNSDDTQIYSFKTAKEAGATDEFVFAAVIDLGTMGDLGLSDKSGKDEAGVLSPGERNTIQALQSNMGDFDFLLHPGDIAYADYWLKEEVKGYLQNVSIEDGYKVYEQILNAFYEEMQPITANRPYMVSAGNHEADCDNGGYKKYTNSICMEGQTNFTGYKNHFRMPGAESGGEGSFWYSFDYGLVHFLIYNTETDLGNGLEGPEDFGRNGPEGTYKNQQLDFINKDLASVNRTATPWVIAAGHRPYYVAGSVCKECQEAFEQIFIDNNVDIIINGHVHNYERVGPIANGVVDPNGLNDPSSPLYILNGIGGHYDGIDALDYPLPEYVKYAQDTAYGWSRFTVHNCTHITHEFVSSSNDSVLDVATLYKNRTCIDAKANSTSSVTSSAYFSSMIPTSVPSVVYSNSFESTKSVSSQAYYSNYSTSVILSSKSSRGTSLIEGSTTSLETSTLTSQTIALSTSTSCSDEKGQEFQITKTNHENTQVTITSCSENKCSEKVVPLSSVVSTTTVNGEETIYTTLCTLDNLSSLVSTLPDVSSEKKTSATTITEDSSSTSTTSSLTIPPEVNGASQKFIPYILSLLLAFVLQI